MATPAYYPFRSEAAKESCLAYFDTMAARDWPVVSEERLVPTSYGQTFVRISGPSHAPPLILLHGAAATSLMWTPNIRALSAEFRTFAVDQVGDFGRGTCTRPVSSFNNLVEWLDELLDALELRSGVNLMGISYGGALTAQYALRHPERLNKIVPIAPAATVLRLNPVFMARLMLAAFSRKRFLPSLVRWMFADMARKDPPWIEATLELLLLNMRSLQRRKVPIPGVLTDAEWAGMQPPALFLVGENEVIYSARKAVSRLKKVAPRISTAIIPDAGHDLTFAQADMINRMVIEFLRQEAAPTH